jgi:hypothetical protein
MLVVYTTLANAARVGTRYAIVHGSDSSATVAQVQAVVTGYLWAAPMNGGNATVNVTYGGTGCGTAATTAVPGCNVTVAVTYPFTPLISYFPLSVTLGSTSQGVIAY